MKYFAKIDLESIDLQSMKSRNETQEAFFHKCENSYPGFSRHDPAATIFQSLKSLLRLKTSILRSSSETDSTDNSDSDSEADELVYDDAEVRDKEANRYLSTAKEIFDSIEDINPVANNDDIIPDFSKRYYLTAWHFATYLKIFANLRLIELQSKQDAWSQSSQFAIELQNLQKSCLEHANKMLNKLRKQRRLGDTIYTSMMPSGLFFNRKRNKEAEVVQLVPSNSRSRIKVQ